MGSSSTRDRTRRYQKDARMSRAGSREPEHLAEGASSVPEGGSRLDGPGTAAVRHRRRPSTRSSFNATELALRESEERFRATFDQAPVGIDIIDPGGHWLHVNQRICEILG